jgi:hypothetical protein
MNAVGNQVRGTLAAGCTWAVFCGLAVACTSGCKTGTAGVKPSWWSFGGSSTADPALASAPAFEGSVQKPSDAAKPYPTTTTPNGYVLNDTAGAAANAGPTQSEPDIPAAVTYGSTPKPTTAAAAATATAAVPAVADARSAQPQAAVAAQVGPYAGLSTEPETPPGLSSATPGLTPVPQTAATATPPAYPAAPGSAFGAPPVPPATAPRDATVWSPAAAAPAAMSEGRYGSTSGSRFASLPPATGGLSAAPPSAGPPLSGSTDSAGLLPAGLDPLPAAAATAAAPAAGLSAPSAAALPPAAGPAFAPATAPAGSTAPVGGSIGLPPASPPPRRPDPGYRPGGTSSYRPSRAILADDATMADQGVRPASFEAPAVRAPGASAANGGLTSP